MLLDPNCNLPEYSSWSSHHNQPNGCMCSSSVGRTLMINSIRLLHVFPVHVHVFKSGNQRSHLSQWYPNQLLWASQGRSRGPFLSELVMPGDERPLLGEEYRDYPHRWERATSYHSVPIYSEGWSLSQGPNYYTDQSRQGVPHYRHTGIILKGKANLMRQLLL